MDNLIQPPRASYFQFTFTKPAIMDGTVYQLPIIRKSASEGATDVHTSSPPTHSKVAAASSTIEIIVGTQGTHVYTRKWHLSRALLAKHSSTIRDLPEDEKSITLASTSPQIFQIYIDYTHSSIYSLTRLIPVPPLRQHTSAWLLGSNLGSPGFCAAALRALHVLFEPCARSGHSTAAQSPIKVEDMEYVCKESAVGSSLRIMYFDAVAAHWTRFEAGILGSADDENVDMDRSASEDEDSGKDGEKKEKEEKVRWADLYAKYPDFKSRILLSLMFSDGRRDVLLRPAEEYVPGKKTEQEPARGRQRVGQFRGPVRVAVRSTDEGRVRRNTERERRPKAGLRPSPLLEERVMVTVSGEDIVEGKEGGGTP